MTMKFDDLTDPTCTHCGAEKLQRFGAMVNREGDVQSVHCIPCEEGMDLDAWDRDKRLFSGLTLTAALKAQSRPMEFLAAPRFQPPHPWGPEVMFPKGDGFVRVQATLYSPRDPDFRGPVAMTAATATHSEMREFVGGREFAVFEEGRLVGSGVVKPWDLRWLDIAEASERVHAAVKATLEPLVWFGGLAAIVRPAKLRGLKGAAETAVGRVEMVTYSSAGRCLIQLDTPTDRVTCITAEDEDEPRMGVQGIDATADVAVSLLCAVSEAWRAGAFKMRESADVGM
jgi:hypothetical protein